METREQREQAFHDEEYEQRTRLVLSRFQTTTRQGTAAYHSATLLPGPGATALDIGCGLDAMHPLLLAQHGIKVTAIDISPVAIQTAMRSAAGDPAAGNISFRVMDAQEPDVPDAFFDLVCGKGVIHHLDLDRVFAAVVRILKPTGYAVFIEPLGHNPALNLFRRLTPGFRTPDERPLRLPDIAVAERYFDSVGLEYYSLLTPAAALLHGTPLFEPTLTALEALDRAVFTFPPARPMAWTAVITLSGPRPAS